MHSSAGSNIWPREIQELLVLPTLSEHRRPENETSHSTKQRKWGMYAIWEQEREKDKEREKASGIWFLDHLNTYSLLFSCIKAKSWSKARRFLKCFWHKPPVDVSLSPAQDISLHPLALKFTIWVWLIDLTSAFSVRKWTARSLHQSQCLHICTRERWSQRMKTDTAKRLKSEVEQKGLCFLPSSPVSCNPANLCMAIRACVTAVQAWSWPVDGSGGGR